MVNRFIYLSLALMLLIIVIYNSDRFDQSYLHLSIAAILVLLYLTFQSNVGLRQRSDEGFQASDLIETSESQVTKNLADQIENTSQIVKFENNKLPDVKNDMTINFWIRTTRPTSGTGKADSIFFKGNESENVPEGEPEGSPAMSWLAESNRLSVQFRTCKKGEGTMESCFAVPPNEWHHISLTLKDKIQTLYYDGKPANQLTLSEKVVFVDRPLLIGGFRGQLANVQFSNFAMKPSQILVLMGKTPDEAYNKIIRQIWRDVGCLTDPIPIEQPFKYPEWKTLIKNDQKSRIEGQIAEIKKKADAGNPSYLELCYGKFTAGMLGKLNEKDEVIKFALENQKNQVSCLPMTDKLAKTSPQPNKIENHPQYADLIRRLEKQEKDKHNQVKCWGCEIPKSTTKN